MRLWGAFQEAGPAAGPLHKRKAALPTRRRLREAGRRSTLTLIRSGLLTRKDMESAFVLPHAARERTGNLQAQERVTPSRLAPGASPAPGSAHPGPGGPPRPGGPYTEPGRPASTARGPRRPRRAATTPRAPHPLLRLRPPLTGRRRCACDASTPPRDAGARGSRRVRDVAAEAPARASGGKRPAPCWLPQTADEVSPPRARPAAPRARGNAPCPPSVLLRCLHGPVLKRGWRILHLHPPRPAQGERRLPPATGPLPPQPPPSQGTAPGWKESPPPTLQQRERQLLHV